MGEGQGEGKPFVVQAFCCGAGILPASGRTEPRCPPGFHSRESGDPENCSAGGSPANNPEGIEYE